MLVFILILIIIFLLYKEYKFSKKVASLLNSYLFLLKLSYLHDKKKTIQNLNILLSFINNTHTVGDWNTVLTTLAEAWETSAPKQDLIVDGDKTLKNIIEKLDYSIKELDFKRLVEEAKKKLKKLSK